MAEDIFCITMDDIEEAVKNWLNKKVIGLDAEIVKFNQKKYEHWYEFECHQEKRNKRKSNLE